MSYPQDSVMADYLFKTTFLEIRYIPTKYLPSSILVEKLIAVMSERYMTRA